MKAAYEAGATGGNKGVAGVYTQDAMGYDAGLSDTGSWSRML
jgi:hypothetical protein